VVDEQNRIAPLADILSSCKNEITLIVTDSDRISRTISEELEKKEITAEVLAYSMQLDEKQKIVSAVMEKNCGVMVSCEAALNGLNLPKIDHLISWELPSHLENYWNRLDRFTYQGDLNVTVLVDTARSGAIRILEKRLGRSMTALPGSLPIPSGNERGRPQPREDRRISSRPIDNDPVIKKNYDEKVIPQRFRDPVFTDPSDVEKYAPEGLKNKSLGSKFVPSGKKKSKKKE
jgi:superfamily II DNA/RNA helicase